MLLRVKSWRLRAVPYSKPPEAFELSSDRLPAPGGRGCDFAEPHLRRRGTGKRSVPSGIHASAMPAEFKAKRKSRLFRFDGSFLLRLADRKFLVLLFQLPPRLTRFEPQGPLTVRRCNTA